VAEGSPTVTVAAGDDTRVSTVKINTHYRKSLHTYAYHTVTESHTESHVLIKGWNVCYT